MANHKTTPLESRLARALDDLRAALATKPASEATCPTPGHDDCPICGPITPGDRGPAPPPSGAEAIASARAICGAVLAPKAAPPTCPTCVSDDPRFMHPTRSTTDGDGNVLRDCPDPFHDITEPTDHAASMASPDTPSQPCSAIDAGVTPTPVHRDGAAPLPTDASERGALSATLRGNLNVEIGLDGGDPKWNRVQTLIDAFGDARFQEAFAQTRTVTNRA